MVYGNQKQMQGLPQFGQQESEVKSSQQHMFGGPDSANDNYTYGVPTPNVPIGSIKDTG